MKRFSLVMLGATATLLALSAPGAHAQVSYSPTTVVSTIMEGTTLTFTASITNTSAASVTLGGDNINISTIPFGGQAEAGAPSSILTLAVDDTPYDGFGVTLGAGATQTVTLYAVTAGLAAIPGTYTGYFDLQDINENDLGVQNFSFTVSPLAAAPEPGGWVALLVGSGTLSVLALRRRRTA